MGETGSAVINDLFKVTKCKIGMVNLDLGQSIAEYGILCDPSVPLFGKVLSQKCTHMFTKKYVSRMFIEVFLIRTPN